MKNIKRTPLDHILRIGVAAMLMAIPLYPKFPIFNVPGTYVAIRLEDLLITAVTFVWLIKLFTIRAELKLEKLKQSSTAKAFLLFWGIGFISLISAYFITHTVVPHIALLHTFRRIEYMILFFITLTTIRSWDDIRFYIEVILLTTFFIFLYGFGQKYFEFPIISTMNREYSKGLALTVMTGGRLNSTFAGHYDLAAYTVVVLNILAAVIATARRNSMKLWGAFLFLTSFWLLLVSASRISTAAYLGSIGLTLWFLHKRWWIVPVLGLSLVGFSFAPSLLPRFAEFVNYEVTPRVKQVAELLPQGPTPTPSPVPTNTPTPTATPTPLPGTSTPQTQTTSPAVAAPVEEISDPTTEATPTPRTKKERVREQEQPAPPPMEDRSTSIRFAVEWPRALRALAKNPLLGTGYSSITLATDNNYLRILGEIGILGLLAFFLIFATVFKQTKQWIFTKPTSYKHGLVIGLCGATVGLLANALFIDVFAASKIASFYWMLLAILIGTVNILVSEKKKK